MEICINEWSLTGQYTSEQEYIDKGLFPVIEVLRSMESSPYQCYIISTLYGCYVTPTHTLYRILTDTKSRQSDEIRRFKSLLISKLSVGPYWDMAPKHSATDLFLMDTKDVGGTSLAEACERDQTILSFWHIDFVNPQINIQKNKVVIPLQNIFNIASYIEYRWERGDISFQGYITFQCRYSKLDFSYIDTKEGFSLISIADEALFADAFRMFREMSWAEIRKLDGFDYKEYTNVQKNSIAILKSRKVHKFRIGQKYRCFGEENKGVFHVLMFDLTHKLSD